MKKLIAVATGVAALTPLLAFATPIIELPEGFLASMLTAGSQIFEDFSTIIYTVMGIIVGFWVVHLVMGLVGRRGARKT